MNKELVTLKGISIEDFFELLLKEELELSATKYGTTYILSLDTIKIELDVYRAYKKLLAINQPFTADRTLVEKIKRYCEVQQDLSERNAYHTGYQKAMDGILKIINESEGTK